LRHCDSDGEAAITLLWLAIHLDRLAGAVSTELHQDRLIRDRDTLMTGRAHDRSKVVE
jgi:hypothetical protein